VGGLIRIRYRRPPDREQIFEQRLVARLGAGDDGAVVTLLDRAGVREPSIIDGAVVLERDSPIVWFTWPGRRHDVGRFHLPDGTFTGWYANILTPVHGVAGSEWSTTDLFLDVWLPAEGGSARVLDEDELEEAEQRGWIDAATAGTARREARSLLDAASRGTWPPPAAHEWTLQRTRAAAEGGYVRSP